MFIKNNMEILSLAHFGLKALELFCVLKNLQILRKSNFANKAISLLTCLMYFRNTVMVFSKFEGVDTTVLEEYEY